MFRPDVLADGHADFRFAQRYRRRIAARFEVAVLVENIVSRQERFECFLDRRAGLEQRGGIVKWFSFALVPFDIADEQRRCAQSRLEFFEHLQILRDEPRLEDEVLRRITGDRKFWRQHQVRAGLGQSLVGSRDLFEVPAQIADGRIDLGEADLHAPQTMCGPGVGNRFPVRGAAVCDRRFVLRLGFQTNAGLGVLVTFVQGFVGAGHKHFSPLEQRRGQEPGDGADHDFLEKGGVHGPPLSSRSGASAITKIPIAGSA